MKHLFSRKRLLSLGLALLLMAVLVGAGLLLIPRPVTRWSFQAGPYPTSFFSPIVSNGLVYTVFNMTISNYLYALDAHSGQVRWSSSIEGFIPAAPVVADGLVYVLADDQVDSQSTLHVLDAASGRERWSYQHTQFSSPTIGNGMVYVHSIDGNLLALDALSGRQLWSAQVGTGFFDAPLVTNHLVYVDAENQALTASTVFALDAVSGARKWSAVEATPFIDQLSATNGLIYVAAGGTDAQVWALDALSGRTAWSAQLAGSGALTHMVFSASSLQVVNGMVYVDYAMGGLNGLIGPSTLYALDARTGQQVWTAPTVSAEPTIANGKVYAFSGNISSVDGTLICPYGPCPSAPYPADIGNGTLSALDARTGRQEWSHQAVPFTITSSIEPEPALVNGTVYIWTTKSKRIRWMRWMRLQGACDGRIKSDALFWSRQRRRKAWCMVV